MKIRILFVLAAGAICNLHASSNQPTLPWGELSTAIVRGNLDDVKAIVPSKIKASDKSEQGLTPIDIAKNAKKGFDEVANYVAVQIKEESMPKPVPGGWTTAHGAASRALEDFVNSLLSENESKAKKDLGQALRQVETIVNADENLQAKSPTTKQTLLQQFNLIEEIVGKREDFGEDMGKLFKYLHRPGPAAARPPTPTGDDWHELRDGLDNGVLFMVKEVLPRKIKATDKMPDGQEIKTVAFFHKRRHDQILNYLQEQLKVESAGPK